LLPESLSGDWQLPAALIRCRLQINLEKINTQEYRPY